MAANTLPIYPDTPVISPVTIVNSDGTNKKTVITAGSNGTRVDSLRVASDDTADATVSFYVTVGGSDYFLQNVAVPRASGTTGTWVEALSLVNSGLPMVLAAGASIKCAVSTAVTSGKTMTLVASGGNY